MQCSGFRVQGSGVRVQGSECRVQGAGLRVEGVAVSGPRRPDLFKHGPILYVQTFNLNLASSEVYHTIFFMLLVKIMLCSKLHRQKVFN